jgi:hypothetical protein
MPSPMSEPPDYESGGRTFESFRARQKPNKYRNNLHLRNDAMQKEIICMASAWLRSHCLRDLQIGANGTAGTRRTLQPSALSECGKINSRWRIPSTRTVAGAKLQSELLVAIGNP